MRKRTNGFYTLPSRDLGNRWCGQGKTSRQEHRARTHPGQHYLRHSRIKSALL